MFIVVALPIIFIAILLCPFVKKDRAYRILIVALVLDWILNSYGKVNNRVRSETSS